MKAVELTERLVDAIRMLARANIVDHSGHGSARRDSESFYVNSAASTRNALTTDDLVTIDLDGNLVEGSARPPFEFHIHSEIYRVRPDVHAVMHTHPRWSTFLTMVGARYRAVCAQGALLGDIPLLDSPLSVNTRPMGEKVAATLGNGPAVLLKSHGAVVVGSDIVECFALAAYLEENAYRQYMAMQIGDPYVFSEAEQRAFRERRTCSGRRGITIGRGCEKGAVPLFPPRTGGKGVRPLFSVVFQAPVHTSLDVADVLGHDCVRCVPVALADRFENQPVIVAVSQSVPSARRYVEGRSRLGRHIGKRVHQHDQRKIACAGCH